LKNKNGAPRGYEILPPNQKTKQNQKTKKMKKMPVFLKGSKESEKNVEDNIPGFS